MSIGCSEFSNLEMNGCDLSKHVHFASNKSLKICCKITNIMLATIFLGLSILSPLLAYAGIQIGLAASVVMIVGMVVIFAVLIRSLMNPPSDVVRYLQSQVLKIEEEKVLLLEEIDELQLLNMSIIEKNKQLEAFNRKLHILDFLSTTI